MAQVALSRAQPSSPHRPLSRSSRGRPFIFTSAIARELADRAALTCRFKPLKKTVAIRSSPRRHSVHATECREGENPSAIVSLTLSSTVTPRGVTAPSDLPLSRIVTPLDPRDSGAHSHATCGRITPRTNCIHTYHDNITATFSLIPPRSSSCTSEPPPYSSSSSSPPASPSASSSAGLLRVTQRARRR